MLSIPKLEAFEQVYTAGVPKHPKHLPQLLRELTVQECGLNNEDMSVISEIATLEKLDIGCYSFFTTETSSCISET